MTMTDVEAAVRKVRRKRHATRGARLRVVVDTGVLERKLAPAVIERFLAYPWPGNVRELYRKLKRWEDE